MQLKNWGLSKIKMPIYEFKCSDCKKIFEINKERDGDDNIICPYCGSKNVKRIFSATNFINRDANYNSGRTCCGREERCSRPPCSDDNKCIR